MAEWVELTGDQSAQVAPKGPVGHRPRSGVNDASRQLGIERTDVQRALKVASLSPEAQAKARETRLDDNPLPGCYPSFVKWIVGIALAGAAVALVVLVILGAKRHDAGSIANFDFADFKDRELSKRGVHDRTVWWK